MSAFRTPGTTYIHTPSIYQLSKVPTCALKCQRRNADFEMAIFVLYAFDLVSLLSSLNKEIDTVQNVI